MSSSLFLTPTQRRYWLAIITLERHFGYPPSVREIGVALGGYQPNAVQRVLCELACKGYVSWESGRRRTLRVLKRQRIKRWRKHCEPVLPVGLAVAGGLVLEVPGMVFSWEDRYGLVKARKESA